MSICRVQPEQLTTLGDGYDQLLETELISV